MTTEQPRGALVRLQRELGHLKAAERQVADVCLARADEVVAMSVHQLAEAAGVSTATVVRLCQALGFTGFSQFKIVMAAEIAPELGRVREDVTPDDTPSEVAAKVFRAEATTLEDTITALDREAFERATALLASAGRVRFFGVGTSAPVAMDAAFQFQQFGMDALAITDAIQMEILAMALDKDTAVVGISHSGATRATVDALAQAKAQQAPTVCVTTYARSPIRESADVALVVAMRETSYRSEATASRLAHLVVLDALNVAVANLDSEAHARAHHRSAEVVARHSV